MVRGEGGSMAYFLVVLRAGYCCSGRAKCSSDSQWAEATAAWEMDGSCALRRQTGWVYIFFSLLSSR